MNIDKSYGVDNLMLSKEQRFLILEMIADRELYPYINDYLKRARVIAEAFRLPLVIYQKKTNRVQIITKDTYMKKPLQF